MSNDNLKERLTDMSVLASSRTPADALQYIEELEAEIADLKAKLAKAVEALECAKDYVGATSDGDLIAHEEPKVIKYIIKEQAEEDLASICTTLAELTGGKDE